MTKTTEPVTKPTVLAIGYKADTSLRLAWRDRVIFHDPDQISRIEDIPESIKRIILARKIWDSPDGMRFQNLARACLADFEVLGSSLLTLRSALARLGVRAGRQKPALVKTESEPVVMKRPKNLPSETEVKEELHKRITSLENQVSDLTRELDNTRRERNKINNRFERLQAHHSLLTNILNDFVIRANLANKKPPDLE